MNLFIVIGYRGEDVAQVVGDINENLTEAKAVLADNVEDYNKLEIWSRNQGCVREKKLSSRENLKLIVVQKNKGKIKRAEATAEVVAEVEASEQSETSTVDEEPTQEAEAAEVVETEVVSATKATAKARSSAKSTKTTK